MSGTPNLGITHLSASQADKTTTINAAMDGFDAALTALLAHTMTDANYTLSTVATPSEATGYLAYVFTGTLTAGRNIVVPAVKKLYVVQNNTTGGFALTVKTSGGTGIAVAVAAGIYQVLYCDGTNVVQFAPGAVSSVAGRTGAVTLAESDITSLVSDLAAKAPLASPTFTGTPAAPTPSGGDNTTKVATTAFVMAAITALVNSSPSTLDTLKELADALGDDPNYATTISTALGLKAPLASPALTGTPTAPTATALDNTTKVATTAYADAAVAVEKSRAQTAEALSELLANKNAANGYLGADSGGNLPGSHMPTTFTGSGNGGYLTPWGQNNLPQGASGASALATNKLFAMILVGEPATIRKMAFNVSTSVNGAKIYIAVYDSTGTLVANSSNGGQALTAATGNYSTTLGTPVTLNPGTYYVFMQADTTGVSLNGLAMGVGILLANANQARWGTCANGISGAAVPGTLGALTLNNASTIPAFILEA